MAAQGEQQLLFALRSPTTPLPDKLERASAALDASPSSTSLPPLVRDWAFEVLLKSTRNTFSDSPLVKVQLWEVLARVTEAISSTSTPSALLPIFVSFAVVYSEHVDMRSAALLRPVVRTWRILAQAAMRKGTPEAGLDSYDKLLSASLLCLQDRSLPVDAEERKMWEELAVVWLRALGSVVFEAGKAGKRIPAQTLALLPKLLSLLQLTASTSPFRLALLHTIQLALFNVENLRRGLARESYIGGGSSQSSAPGPESELLAALTSLPPATYSSVLSALPAFTSSYFSAISAHSTTLFPLPAKATFPTPSAQKSALEVLGLTRQRELAARWLQGVVELIGWQSAEEQANGAEGKGAAGEKAGALAGVLAVIERDDLYRAGQADEAWEGLLPTIARGATARLQLSEALTLEQATIDVLAAVSRLSYDAVEPELSTIFPLLARTAASIDNYPSAAAIFLNQLVAHHSRSLTVPAFLSLVADALASSKTTLNVNNLLAAYLTSENLAHAMNNLSGGADSALNIFSDLIKPLSEAFDPSVSGSDHDEPSPAKRRRVSLPPSPSADQLTSVVGRLRVAGLFVAQIPSAALSSLVAPVKTLVDELFKPKLTAYRRADGAASSSPGKKRYGAKEGKKRRKSGGVAEEPVLARDPELEVLVELLEVRYTMVERLASERLLEDVAGEGQEWWRLTAEEQEALRKIVETGRGEAVVVAARTLLQYLELGYSKALSEGNGQALLQAILVRLAESGDSTRASSFMRGIGDKEVPVALWELISRRWLLIIVTIGSDAQLDVLLSPILRCLSQTSASADLSTNGATIRLLRRADFWELQRLQTIFQSKVVALASLPNLTSPNNFDELDAKTLSSLRSLSPATLVNTASLLSSVMALVPLESLSRSTRTQLAERAVSLDLWLSRGEAELDVATKETVQRNLRLFVDSVGGITPGLSSAVPRILSSTLPGGRKATLQLYRSFVLDAIDKLKTTQEGKDVLPLLESFGTSPLDKSSASTATDKSSASTAKSSLDVTVEGSAFLLLLETLAIAFPALSELPPNLLVAYTSAVEGSRKSFRRILLAASAVLRSDSQAIFELADLLEASCSLSVVSARMESRNENFASTLDTFTDHALSAVLAQLPSMPTRPTAARTVLTLSQLFSHRVQRTPSRKLYETFLASHAMFRQVLASSELDGHLVRCTSAISLEDYGAILDSVCCMVGTLVSGELSAATLDEVAQVFKLTFVLVRDGPEGSRRYAGAALSDLIRHAAALVERGEGQDGDVAVRAFFVAAHFLESVSAERPMLLSRLNISATISLVLHLLQSTPSTTLPPRPATSSPQVVSDLFLSLVSTLTHLVRHRKDHVVPLFPLLVSGITGAITILRRGGSAQGSTPLSVDDLDLSLGLGQRAEREARMSFPPWVWEGGATAIGCTEAKAVGRLLGALTSRTTAQVVKRKTNPENTADEGPATTTSLAAPLSKHAPFLLLTYLRSCVHPTCAIPSSLRNELQGGLFEVLDSMGKWEKEALMKGFLGEEEEAERSVLRSLWRSWEKERYRG